MRIAVFLLALAVTEFSVFLRPLAGQEAEVSDSIYVVAEYDPSRDPAVDLEAAVERASAEGKRILLEVGGTWCIDCLLLDLFVSHNPDVAERLRKGFVVLKVNVSEENENDAFLAEYPEIEWYPHIFVLDGDGSFLHSQDSRELQDRRHIAKKLFLQFLDKWASPGHGADGR